MTDEDTVYVTTCHGNRETYHTQECCSFPQSYSEWQQSTAEAWGLRECEECQGGSYRQEWGRGAPSNE